ncbi:MAG: hypothetical protein ABIT70_05760, partial [Sulfuriferula sp.]
ELQQVFDELRAGSIKHKEVSELTNCVGKMIGLAKVQLEYHALRKEIPNILFLSAPKEAKATSKP